MKTSQSLVTLAILALGAMPLHCIGDPILEHNMAEMTHASDKLTPATLGSVSFQTSCRPQVKKGFNHAVALLHSFWLDEAERTFKAVAKRDPDCAMAQWGVAMSHFNQVNGWPTPAGAAAANQALAKADAAREKDSREAAYLRALHRFFDGFVEKDFQKYAERYSDAMAQVAAANSNDLEVQVFYALALINSEPRDDVVLANKKRAVAILYPLFRVHPNHPGIAHYIIHACDNPGMAQEGIEAAVRYAVIAPAAPHALHMPSHIRMRLGLWQEDIRSNLASKAASEDPTVHVGAEARLHAIDFLEYAYLQSGQYSQTAGIAAEAKTVLAHAIAAGHLHDAKAGKAAGDALEASVAPYPQVRAGSPNATLPDEIRAWARFSQGDVAGAIGLLKPVADRQDKLGEESIEVPAREMLAQMLLLDGQFAEAYRSIREYWPAIRTVSTRFWVPAELRKHYASPMLQQTITAHCWQIARVPMARHWRH